LLVSQRVQATPESEALGHLNDGIDLFRRGELAQARIEFLRSRDLFPNKPNPHRWLGLTAARLGECAEAVVELDRFLSLAAATDPRRGEADEVRLQCLARLAPPAQAVSRPPDAVVSAPRPVVQARLPQPARRRAWVVGVVLGAAAAAGLAIGLGVGLGARQAAPHVYPPVGAPP
jgi:hypothetical protein